MNQESPNTQDKLLLGYDWSYRFGERWTLHNRFQALFLDYDQLIQFATELVSDRFLQRGLWRVPQDRNSYATNLDLTGRFDTGPLRHDILLGVDYFSFDQGMKGGGFSGTTPLVFPIDIFNPVYGISLASIQALPNNFHFRRDEEWTGVYFQDQITVWDKLHILGGGRYDWASTASAVSNISLADAERKLQTRRDEGFNPRVGLVYQPWPWLSLYGNYVESFGANNGRSASGEPFDPETAQQYEVGVKSELWEGRLIATLALFDLTKQNILTPDLSTPDPTDSIAIGEVRSRGIEFDATGQIDEHLSLIAAYAYDDIEITKDNGGNQGHRLPAVPLHAGSLWARYDFDGDSTQGLNLGAGVYLRGQRQGDNANSFQLPGYARLDAFAAYRWKLGPSYLTAQVNVTNLLDKTYYDPPTTA